MLVVRALLVQQFTLHTRWLVGGKSVASSTIYATYVVFGYSYAQQFTLQTRKPLSVVPYGQQRRQTKEERERDRLRRQIETAREREDNFCFFYHSLQEIVFPLKHLPPQPN